MSLEKKRPGRAARPAAGRKAPAAAGRKPAAAKPAAGSGVPVPAHLAGLMPGTVKCPKCGAAQTAVPVTVLRPEDGALGLLFQGTLNTFSCVSCGVRFKLDVALLYRDDDRRRVVYYLPAEDKLSPDAAEEQVQSILAACFGTDAAGEAPLCRLVATRQEFIEKIAILRAGLDDRLVEFIKYQLYLKYMAQMNPASKRLLYDFTNGDAERLVFIIFDRTAGRALSATEVPMDAYRELAAAAEHEKDMREEIAKLFPGMHVNAAACFSEDASRR